QKPYPPKGGAAALPKPNPPKPQEPAGKSAPSAPVSAQARDSNDRRRDRASAPRQTQERHPVSQQKNHDEPSPFNGHSNGVHQPAAPPQQPQASAQISAEWLQAYVVVQQQTAEAHAAYARAMADA